MLSPLQYHSKSNWNYSITWRDGKSYQSCYLKPDHWKIEFLILLAAAELVTYLSESEEILVKDRKKWTWWCFRSFSTLVILCCFTVRVVRQWKKITQKSCVFSVLGSFQNWTQPWAAWCSWLCFENGYWSWPLQRSLPALSSDTASLWIK